MQGIMVLLSGFIVNSVASCTYLCWDVQGEVVSSGVSWVSGASCQHVVYSGVLHFWGLRFGDLRIITRF